jgi:hypothetical protein
MSATEKKSERTRQVAYEREIYTTDDRDYLIGFVELNKHSDFAARIRRMLRAYDDMNKQRARAVVAFKKLSGTYK